MNDDQYRQHMSTIGLRLLLATGVAFVLIFLHWGAVRFVGIASDNYDLRTAAATEALATFQFWTTAIALVSFGGIAWTLRETRRTAIASIEAAKTSATAARAFLFATVGRPVKVSDDERAALEVVITNDGQTPARNVTVDVIQPTWLRDPDADLSQPWSEDLSVVRLFDRGAIGGRSRARWTIVPLIVDEVFLMERALYGYPYYVTVQGTYETALAPGVQESLRLTFVYVQHPQGVETRNEFGWQIREGAYLR